MPAKWNPPDGHNIIERYREGESSRSIGRSFGVTELPIIRILREAGEYRGLERTRKRLPVEQMAALYRDGASANELAKQFGVSRCTVEDRLLKQGVALRGVANANALMMSRRTPEQHRHNTNAAHFAVEGRRASFRELCLRARVRQGVTGHMSDAERELRFMLLERNLVTTPQQAVGPYNCDLGAAPVAVEVWGGNWHYTGRHMRRTPERIRYLADHGWEHLFVWLPVASALTEAAADYVVARVEAARSNPPERCEYRVIGGTGELLASGSADDDERTIVETLRSAVKIRRLDEFAGR